LKVYVTGANGFIGREVTKLLSTHYVIALVKDYSNAHSISRYVNEVVKGDLTKGSEALDAIRRSDAVIHLAAKVRFHPYNLLRRVMVDATDSIAAQCLKNNVRLVYASSIAVYGDANSSMVDEYHRCRPDTGYGKAKLDAEDIIRKYLREGLDAVILRPGYVYGYGDAITRMLRSGRIIWLGDATNYIGVVHVHDCARAFTYFLSDTTDDIRVYNVVDEEPVRWIDYLNYLCSLASTSTSTSMKPILLPYTPIKSLVYISYYVSRLFSRVSDLSPDLIRAIRYSAKYSNARLRSTGFIYKYPSYRDGLKEVIEQFHSSNDGN